MDMKLIVALCAVVVALSSVAGLMQLGKTTILPNDTDMESFQVSCQDFRGLGNYPDLAGDNRERGELFYTTKGLTSWLTDGKSQTIIVQAHVKRTGDFWCPAQSWFSNHRYVFEINEGQGFKPLEDPFIKDPVMGMEAGIFEFKQRINIDGTFPLMSLAFEIDGIVRDGAVLRVTYEGFISIPEKWWEAGKVEWRKLASDEMVLRSAIPYLEWRSGQYTVGENAILDIEIPFVYFDEGDETSEYYLTVVNRNTGINCEDTTGTLLDRVPILDTVSVWKVPILPEMYSAVFPECLNELRATIYNEIVNAGQDDVSYINVTGTGPTITKLESDRAEYEEGDTVTVTWEVKENLDTGAPIGKFHVTFSLGGLNVCEDTNLPPGQTTMSCRAPTTGFLHVEVVAYDIECRPSPVKEIKIEVGNVLPPKFCELYPEDKRCKDDKAGINWYESIILGVAMVALLLIVGVEVWGLSAVGMTDWRILLAVVGGTLAIGLIFIGMLFIDFSINGLTPPKLW